MQFGDCIIGQEEIMLVHFRDFVRKHMKGFT